jgi:transposase
VPLRATESGYIASLTDIEAGNPTGDIFVITDNLSSHNSAETCAWLAEHPRIHHVFIPKGACWLNLQEGWWRLFRRDALAGQSFANPDEIAQATRVASQSLDLGSPCQGSSALSPPLFLSPLRNAAVAVVC